MKEFNELREKYDRLFDRLLNGYKFYYSYEHEYHFKDEKEHEMKIIIGDNRIFVVKNEDNVSTMEIIELPDEETRYVRSVETITEEQENGVKTDDIIRFYGITDYSDDKYYLIDLYQDTICANNQYQSICNRFESHMNHKECNKTRYNSRDISSLYKDVDGPLKVEIIFDMYNGNITKLLNDDLLDSEGFDYKRTSGIKEKEENFLNNNKVYKKI